MCGFGGSVSALGLVQGLQLRASVFQSLVTGAMSFKLRIPF